MNGNLKLPAMLLCLTLLAGCASQPSGDTAAAGEHDKTSTAEVAVGLEEPAADGPTEPEESTGESMGKPAENLFESMPSQFMFCSGAGAWSTVLTIAEDGTFTGLFHDSNNNIQYICEFTGAFTQPEKVSDYVYSMAIEPLELEHPVSYTHLDIHMNVEALLTARIGDAGKRLHTARSRNDQVALDFRMYVREQIPVMVSQLLELETVLCRQAKKYQTAVMPGYTHLQRAQPISFAQHLMAYASMFRRDVTRLEDCRKRLDECPLGSGALAGTTYPIDRWETAQALGFAAPMSNSLDGVSDRDYALELLSGLSILMMHLSRCAEEIILWCSWEFRLIRSP